ncbi:MAG: aminotransferase class V-fold PLP-dependent enzyme [Chloroflexota bacterium]
MTPFNLQAIRQDFPIVEHAVYLNHAAVGPLPRSVETAVSRFYQMRLTQTAAVWDLAQPEYERGRALAAKLVNGQAENIAYIQNTSHGVSLIANGLAWQPGDNVIVPAREFPSNYLVWQNLRQHGVEVREVAVENGRVTAAQIAPLIDAQTRVVTLSHVQYFNGYQVDLAPIGDLCHQHDALLIVDGTQSIGAITLDVARCGIDALVVSAHKWMLGPLGIGFMALSDRAMEQIEVAIVGWLSVQDPFDFVPNKVLLADANRFEPGTENGAGKFGLLARLEQIDAIGADVIETRVLALTDRLCAGVEARGYRVTSHRGEREKSAIVTFDHSAHAGELLLQRLQQVNIQASLRHGAIRISPHYYNSEAEIDLVLETLL